ncbi:peptidylprolyl isomerase [Cellulosilyticum lentocellum]|uniref:PpiC-type peptidyl-prolyl cis-trans isomerase n=1 Tax=Cellulosilyticum lentocellum (strain ATCC 49066 / DSM 5427 / NCIMB 11756 / RHM5) TaxID=642492 RepID=F2JP16_CELLD|nr:peptidylprolyl isomerase [Cellulosilyticum lentocellum]ADZ83630.1 PpiC-type peptidyl-prolyl cis-trans isomerase [Cellulosilyticum lentocellum DSM 5427]
MENKVLAVVDGRAIKQSDLYDLLRSIGQNAMQFQSEEGQKQLVDELVMQELLYSDAIKHGLDKEEEFTAALEQMTKSLLKQYAMGKLLESVTASDEEVKEYYETHQGQFKSDEAAKANHILVATLEEAEKVAEEIKAGLSFAEAAKKYSTCPSASQGGALGEFTRGRMVPEFETAAFAMSPGEISAPVQTQFGYHIIELEALTPAGLSPLEAVKEQVKEQCLLAKRQALYLAKRQELESLYTVEMQ